MFSWIWHIAFRLILSGTEKRYVFQFVLQSLKHDITANLHLFRGMQLIPDSKIHGANMGPPGSCWPQMGTLLSGIVLNSVFPVNVIQWARPWLKSDLLHACIWLHPGYGSLSLIARFMGPTWGPSGAARTQVGPMLATGTLLSGVAC